MRCELHSQLKKKKKKGMKDAQVVCQEVLFVDKQNALPQRVAASVVQFIQQNPFRLCNVNSFDGEKPRFCKGKKQRQRRNPAGERQHSGTSNKNDNVLIDCGP